MHMTCMYIANVEYAGRIALHRGEMQGTLQHQLEVESRIGGLETVFLDVVVGQEALVRAVVLPQAVVLLARARVRDHVTSGERWVF
ncbi:hypothetical protein PG993_013250 [Apiospora rasikravindrae]|uniref:Uncharacterized protein n=1 Tax=Apiospora rasikravindrae TaxID=990691 RepID=A0ABR1RX98_9PEZI